MLALAVHSVVNQKYLGHFAMIVYFVLLATMDLFGFEHLLFKFASNGGYVLSDMNGFGPYPPRIRSMQLYWSAAAVLLAIAALPRLGARDDERLARSARGRAARASPRPWPRSRPSRPPRWSSIGAWVVWNTNVLNPYITDARPRAAAGRLREEVQGGGRASRNRRSRASRSPSTSIRREQRVRMRGTYALENRSGRPVEVVHLNFLAGPMLRVHELAFGVPSTLEVDDMAIGVKRFRLAAPLADGARTELRFDLEVAQRGFRNTGAYTDVVANGSFVNARAVLPVIGYQDERRARVRPRPQEVRPRAEGAHAPARRPGRAGAERAHDRRRLHHVRGGGGDRGRAARDRAGLPRARLERRRAPLLRVPDGRADPQLLRVPVRRATRSGATAGTTSRSRSGTSPATSTTSTG